MSTEAKRLSFDTTQQLRSGFFRSIKRQYSPLLPAKSETAMQAQGSSNTPSPCGSASFSSNSNTDNSNDSDVDLESESRDTVSNTMSQLARQKLEQLRHQGPGKVDVATGLQWIRLELHEMREQDKSLFLQLIKLHSTIKDLRSDFNVAEEFDSYDDLHSAASLWWPRRGYSYSATTLPDFSSSDGAQLIRNGRPKQPLRRGFSLNYPPAVGPPSQPRLNFEFSRPPLTHSTSTDSEVSLSLSDWKSATAC
uniref:uncharacterized protein LOC120335737 n=1 Tax=Styela clava TaxID=7725 RepID=UPI001939BD71|nr:uncharacterized protein LOC120335737 [Styela clava]